MVNRRVSPVETNIGHPSPPPPSDPVDRVGSSPSGNGSWDIHHRFPEAFPRGASPQCTGTLGWGETTKAEAELTNRRVARAQGEVLISLQLLASIYRPSFLFLKEKVDRTAVVTSASSNWLSIVNMEKAERGCWDKSSAIGDQSPGYEPWNVPVLEAKSLLVLGHVYCANNFASDSQGRLTVVAFHSRHCR